MVSLQKPANFDSPIGLVRRRTTQKSRNEHLVFLSDAQTRNEEIDVRVTGLSIREENQMFVSRFLRRAPTYQSNRAIEVGWLLKTDHAGFIWHEPKLARVAQQSNHPKSVSSCPAVI